MTATQARVISDANVTEYFQEQVNSAITRQQVNASSETIYYLVSLLSGFTDIRTLYCKTERHPTLCELYAEARLADSVDERNKALKRLGDIALFIAGIFGDSLNRKLVDIDYYIAMGGTAYSCLSDVAERTVRWQMLTTVFTELANQFPQFVDVLAEVSEQASLCNDRDVLRLYEVWLRTGSKRAEQRLQKHGIYPLAANTSRLQH